MKYRIAIAGIGGVGGYIGGKLACYYENDPEIEIIFIARGLHQSAIAEHGLTLITSAGTFQCRPSLVTADVTGQDRMNLIICCVKNYDLETSIRQLKPVIGSSTVILPLQNGLDSAGTIRRQVADAAIMEGCIYLVSRLTSPGVVTQAGAFHQLYFGSSTGVGDQHLQVEKILIKAGLPVQLVPDVTAVMWEKFLFLSPLAAITSFLNLSIGEILARTQYRHSLQQLITELAAVAVAMNVKLPANIIDRTYKTLESMPYDATSSLHADFKKGNKTELETLLGYVVQLGTQMSISTPVYKTIYNALVKRNKHQQSLY